jgi:ubiquitin carboxyl-terminal hydrolase L5
MGDWCTIESDPAVFTELIHKIGVRGVEVEEVYSIDALEEIKPVHGLIFLFKWHPTPPRPTSEFYDPELVFANQVIQNACATQAILAILLNCPQLDIGQTLTNFKEFVTPLDSQMRGLAISNCDEIRLAHNSFSPAQTFDLGKQRKGKEEDAFHFISYLPFNGRLYELDGLQQGPYVLGECSEDDWIELVKPAIQERINAYAENEIRFTLLAVVSSRRELAEQDLARVRSRSAAICAKLMSLGEAVEDQMDLELDEEVFASLPDSAEQLREELYSLKEETLQLEQLVEQETTKHGKWREENARRKHNYIPFILSLLERLAYDGRLQPLIDQAKKRKTERAQS